MTKGQRIRSRRKELNIGQTDLAEKISVSKQTLYKYEADIVTNIPSDKIEALANALDVSPGYIMGWEDPESIPRDIIDYYIQQADDQALLDAYHHAAPEVRQMIDYLLKSPQSYAADPNSSDDKV